MTDTLDQVLEVGTASEVDLVLKKLADLSDLFRRRLMDDKDKRRLIEMLQEELHLSKERSFVDSLLRSLFLVLDRVDAYQGADPEFVASIAAELVEGLRRVGVEEVPAKGRVDPRIHEVNGVDGSAGTDGTWEIDRLVRRGFRVNERLLRPASVTARRVPCPDDSAETV